MVVTKAAQKAVQKVAATTVRTVALSAVKKALRLVLTEAPLMVGMKVVWMA